MKFKLWHLVIFLALIVSMLPATVAAVPAEPEASPQVVVPERTPQDMTPQLGAAPKPGAGVESLSGSNVTFNPGAGGATCYIPGTTQTFCFDAHSYTNDWEYVYNLWMKFPSDWTVTNAYVVGTPVCTGGGTWGTLAWSFETSPYEINIAHARYQAYTDDCVATYCIDVVAGTGMPNAEESWYWDGDGYNAAPHNPCSDDQYTPASMSGQPCDQYVNPQPEIPPCAMDPGVYLLPPTQEASGCNGVPQEHTLSLLNNTGSAGTFSLSYAVPSANGTLTGPATVTADQGAVVPFVVTLTPDLCAIGGDTVIGQVDGAGNGFTDQALINKTVAAEPGWEAIPASAPTWPGYGYPRDACTALNAAGQWVTYEFGDTTSIFGFWGYNHATNTWFQPAPANLPADRWAPDWAYDPDTNLCYVTGGANTPGGGTYNDAYVFDPVANSFTALGSFTSIRAFHNSWVGTIDGTKYLCLGGGVNSGSVLVQATQCYDLAQAAPGAWNAENAQMGAFPTDPFGAADGVLHAPGGDQFWYVGGAINNFATVTDEARYWDDADNAWHLAGNTGVPRYRVEGDFLDGEFYLLGGSSGGFTPTDTAVKGTFDGVGWTWTTLPNMANIRMDNVANAADGSMWSVDGYGGAASAYVEKLSFCPLCDVQGWLEGTVLDGDTQLAGTAGQGIESLTGSFVTFDPTLGGDTCYSPGTPQTLCYRAESFSPDWGYVYNVWLKFPADWTVTNAYVVGTPYCAHGTFGTFSWSFETSPYEININHLRYQYNYPDEHCVATYCVDVTPGGSGGNASWYWAGDNYGAAPYHPCSSDVYTPASMAGQPCDEAVNPQAAVPPCEVNLGPTCTGATVTINPGNIHAAVDPATGHYGPVMLIAGDYTVEATAPGYSTETAMVTIVDEETTVQDFVLYRPVVDVTPLSISVSAPPNTPVVVPMTISNLGHLPLDWEIVEIPSGLNVQVQPKVPAGTYKQAPAATGLDSFITQQMALAPDGKTDVFVAFKDTADLSAAYNAQGKEAKVQAVRTALTQAADKAQANVRQWLDKQGIDYKVFYVDNTLLIKADRAMLDTLAAFPEVSGFHGNHTYQIMPTEMSQKAGTDATIPWDLNIMNIPQVWDELGVTGEGVIVANVDTGVYYQHEALLPNYLCGSGGPHTDCWADPDGGTTAPNDTHGHGTGTMSQMAADNNAAFQYAVGGAPDAGWIACLGCPGGSCPDTALNGCADWLVMTTPNTPDIVNNSWGTWSALCDPWYDGKIAAYRAAGVVPVWAAGNIGNACGTSTPPANGLGTLAVGATTSGDVQASFSSTGPGLCTGRTQFPDVSAPGDATCGATNSGGYTCGLNGTSFAAPRAAGCLALMKSAAPGADVQQLMDVIMATADNKPNSDCGSPQADPNYRYGDGRVNCFAAVSAIYNADLPWVWENPVTGTIPALDYQPVDITFECTPEQQGWILTGTLKVKHNDPCADDINIPIEMTCGETTAPDIDVQPPALSETLIEGETSVQQLNIGNLGTASLDWTIIEHNPGTAVPQPALSAPTSGSVGRPVELKLEAAGGASVETNPPVVDAPVTLVLDDGSRDNDIGLGGTIEMLWVNRFTPAAGEFPFNLNQIQVYFSSVGLVNVGDDIVLIVYENTSGNNDPAVGSNFLAAIPTTVQAVDAWNVYDLATPIAFNGPGDVIIGVIGMETPGTSYWPASMDQTATQARSWAGWWDTSPPPTPPILPPPNWTLIDAYFPGNWMVRGYGETVAIPPECEPVDIPWASVDPTSGTTLGHAGFMVDVTFDATGLTAGTYTANLCVQSNDPDEPYVTVPLELTVLALQDIEVTPSSLSAEMCPDSTEVQQLTICNNGDLPLTWEMTEVSPTVKLASWTPGPKVSRPVELKLEAAGGASVETNPPVVDAPVTLVLDDGSRDNDIGLGGTIEMLWVNRFTPAAADFPFTLNQIQVYFSTVGLVNVGDDIVLIVYENTSGNNDPAVGSNFLAAIPTTVQAVDAWNVYDLAAPVLLEGPGDVIVGVIGMETPGTSYWPASMDQTATQARSWAGWWNASPPPTPPLLPPENWTLIDVYFPGNWMVRGYGETVTLFDALWLSEDPLAGTVAGHTCQTVDVTFDSTGLAPGDYFAGLLIESNDPDTPEITIPVQLTVLEPAAIAGVTYTVDGLEVTFDATATGLAPLTFAWDFGDGTTSALEDPVHAYAATGCYQVTLTVSNECGEDVWSEEICVTSPYYYYYLPIISRNYGP